MPQGDEDFYDFTDSLPEYLPQHITFEQKHERESEPMPTGAIQFDDPKARAILASSGQDETDVELRLELERERSRSTHTVSGPFSVQGGDPSLLELEHSFVTGFDFDVGALGFET